MCKELRACIQAALRRDKRAIGRLLSLFEDRRPSMLAKRCEVMQLLQTKSAEAAPKQACFIGFTGAPGVGKSSLINCLLQHLLDRHSSLDIAVLAIDPSSALTGGSFLGDRHRLRIKPHHQDRLFFRSQAAEKELGGMSSHSFMSARLLYYLFDLVFLETVGIGQNEIEVQHLADHSILLLQPQSGDQIQFLKAGIMEIPDIFVINKCENSHETQKCLHALRSSLALIQARDKSAKREAAPIICTSAHTGQGIESLAHLLLRRRSLQYSWAEKEDYYFLKWLKEERGRQGLQSFCAERTARQWIEQCGSFEAAQIELSSKKLSY